MAFGLHPALFIFKLYLIKEELYKKYKDDSKSD